MPRLLCGKSTCVFHTAAVGVGTSLASYSTPCALHAAVVVWERRLCLSCRGCCVLKDTRVLHTSVVVWERRSCLTHGGCCVRQLACYTTHCVLHSAAVVWEGHLCLTHRGGCVGKPLVSYMPRRLCAKLHKRQNDVNAKMYRPSFTVVFLVVSQTVSRGMCLSNLQTGACIAPCELAVEIRPLARGAVGGLQAAQL